ncbi:MAG: Clp protease N-terminal domain-containing protein [Anaerolineae bacterium]
MADKFQRFTKRARRVLTLAQQEAERLHHNHIGPEHLLLGLAEERDSLAAAILRDLHVDPGELRLQVEEALEPGQAAGAGKVNLSPAMKRVLEAALAEARHLGHNHIGTEHLLFGLVREEEGPATDVLRGLGVSPDALQARMGQMQRLLDLRG